MAISQFQQQRWSFESYPVGTNLNIIGRFDFKIYENSENGYKIYTFDIEKIIDDDGFEHEVADQISVTGYYEVNEHCAVLPSKIRGSVAAYKGEKQLKAETVEFIEPATDEGIISFLSCGIIKGVGEKTARNIVSGYKSGSNYVEGFGSNTLEVIKNEPLLLTKIRGISPDKARVIHDSYMENMEYQNVMIFFQRFGVSSAKAMKIYNNFKGTSIAIAEQNPYMFADIRGFGFKSCDEIARKLGIDPHSVFRLEAALKSVLQTAEADGNCYLLKAKLLEMTAKALSNPDVTVTTDELEDAYNRMLKSGSLVNITFSEDQQSFEAVYTKEMYKIEYETALAIKEIARCQPDVPMFSVDKLIEEFEAMRGFNLESMQKEAVKAVFNTNMLILTGSAGSGKTTTVECMIYVLQRYFEKQEEMSFMLAAPTGKAAKRLTEITGFEAMTLHRLLQFSYENKGFFYRQGNELPYDLIVVDESSMLSIDLAHALFTAISPGTTVVLIGDTQQIPSVGAGNVLDDMIKSGVIPTVKLNVIKRQEDGSGIIFNANRIINGEMPEIINANKDFFIVEEDDKNRVIKRTLEALNRLMTGYNYTIDDVQVICPQKTSELGTYEMNKAIQEMVNPAAAGKAEVKRGNSVFRQGDKVIHLNNNYEATHYHKDAKTGRYIADEGSGVFNGDIGRIIEISKIGEIDQESEDGEAAGDNNTEEKVAVQYDEFIIIYQINELEEIDLAYSLTVHKMQGSQCEAAIFLCHLRNYIMLNRNLGYTAVTRAKRMACIIGQRKAISVMVQNVKVTQRNTMLADLLSLKMIDPNTTS
ncbi:AAA family ATPase [Ruminiclostridium cellulolyticum]|uniref:ATP-dependent RecD2 DNA helicase n=1 Tax=Ruminiclostridium cellulolyticum (strain ATCC 35319 / DSM 5812 / JCM 6584 / H10) TaxID=394503 RepID=B8I4C3_RUMCH|nr:AAA family ATPase [Ruminiclostridium cellulolyticum]ACL74477.1 exonuclease V subunit alpha [Ruminiclostridium cellulolyticum H10]